MSDVAKERVEYGRLSTSWCNDMLEVPCIGREKRLVLWGGVLGRNVEHDEVFVGCRSVFILNRRRESQFAGLDGVGVSTGLISLF